MLALAAALAAPAAALDEAAVRERLGTVQGDALPPAPSTPASVPIAPAAAAPAKPDWAATPGKLCAPTDPDFDEYRYPERVAHCRRHVTQGMKRQVALRYGIPKESWPQYEFDHLVPLAIGGNSGVENLWPQPRANEDAGGKDALERRLYHQMKAGTITQAEAVRQTYAWFESFLKASVPAAAK